MNEAKAAGTTCGFVAIVGPPNAGKSTLLNALLGTKLAIVSKKVQTTRAEQRGIWVEDKAQAILIDTPGLFTPTKRLDRAMVRAATDALQSADVVILMADAQRGKSDPKVLAVLEHFKNLKTPVWLVLNKVDALKDRRMLLPLTQIYQAAYPFAEIFMLSAMHGDGMEPLKKAILAKLPIGPWHYPADQLTNWSERQWVAELTREQLYHKLQEELPYAATVLTDVFEEFDNGAVKIMQTVYVQRLTQKQIVVGKGGGQIKLIREAAQAEIEAALGRKVHLFLFCKIHENWTEDPEHYEEWGLNHKA